MEQHLPVDELQALANVEVGEALRRTRMHFGQTLEDIESSIRIRASQIDAIERGDISALPGRAYAIGFVRSYAEFMGLDGAEAVRLFKIQYMDGNNNKVDLTFPVPASETKTPALWVVVLCLVLATAFFAGWHMLNGKSKTRGSVIEPVPQTIKSHVTEDIIERPSQTIEVVEFTDDSAQPEIEDMGNEASTSQSGILLNIKGSSWVEIKSGEGEIIVSKILDGGDQYYVPDSPGLSMSLGNAANVEIVVDGKALKPLGKDGDVRRDIPLNTAFLKTLEFQEAVPKTTP